MHGSSIPLLRLKRGKEGPIVAGHPWIFSGAIGDLQGDPQPGAWVKVASHKGEHIAFGLYSPHSKIRVRVVARELNLPPDLSLDQSGAHDTSVAFWYSLIQRALLKRRLLGLPKHDTDAVRLINSEGDGLPGLIVDRFASVLVVQITTLPMDLRRALIYRALQTSLSPDAILQADPLVSANQEGFDPQRGWLGDQGPTEVTFRENGITYTLNPAALQKTGHYLDVREHRAWLRPLTSGRSVFDGFTFTGGFALNALAGGASSVMAVDSSAPALEQARRNAAPLDSNRRATFVHAGVRNQLRSCFDRGRSFDIVVLDPPKFAPNRRSQAAAAKAYTSLAVEAMRILAPGGLLGISSCSHHIGDAELKRALSVACGRAKRDLSIVKVGGQAPDHPYPVAMPEGRYLTFLFAAEC